MAMKTILPPTVASLLLTAAGTAGGSEGALELRKPASATTIRISGPATGKKGQTRVLRIEIAAEVGNPIAPINLVGPGTLALAVPESIDVEYGAIRMRIQPHGERAWEVFDWRAREGLISRGIAAFTRWAITRGLSTVAPDAATFADISQEAYGVLMEEYAPAERIFRDLNRYDVIQVNWDWSLHRWKIGSLRGQGQTKVEITVPFRFTEDLMGDLPLALFLAYENRPRTEGGLAHTQYNAQGWPDLLAALSGAQAGLSNVIKGKDGVEMVLVPAGEFWMGATSEEVYQACSADGIEADACKVLYTATHQPRRRIAVDAFYIDRYEVTNAQFKAFVDVRGYERPELWSKDGWRFRSEAGVRSPGHWGDTNWNGSSQPVVDVSWFEAEAFCRFLEKRLPSEAEWEKAARGTDARRYPWGGVWDASKAHALAEGDWGKYVGRPRPETPPTRPVGSYPAGISPYGVHDMAGNAAEWAANWGDDDLVWSDAGGRYQAKAVRGGGTGSGPFYSRTSYRIGLPPSTRYEGMGFRCATHARAPAAPAPPAETR